MTLFYTCFVTKPDSTFEGDLPENSSVLRKFTAVLQTGRIDIGHERLYLIEDDSSGLLSVKNDTVLFSDRRYLNPSEYIFHEYLEQASLINSRDLDDYDDEIPHLCLSSISLTQCCANFLYSLTPTGAIMINLRTSDATLRLRRSNQLCLQLDSQSSVVIHGNPSCIVVDESRFYYMNPRVGRITIKLLPDQVFEPTLLTLESNGDKNLFERLRARFDLPPGCMISPAGRTTRTKYYIIHREDDRLSSSGDIVVDPRNFGVENYGTSGFFSTMMKIAISQRIHACESLMRQRPPPPPPPQPPVDNTTVTISSSDGLLPSWRLEGRPLLPSPEQLGEPNAEEDQLCILCGTSASNVQLLPCKHSYYCAHCIGEWRSRAVRFTCPICRSHIKQIVPLRDSGTYTSVEEPPLSPLVVYLFLIMDLLAIVCIAVAIECYTHNMPAETKNILYPILSFFLIALVVLAKCYYEYCLPAFLKKLN